MAEFVLTNNYFEFGLKVIPSPVGMKLAMPYTCIFMDKLETDFIKTQKMQPLVWSRYLDDVFFIWIRDIKRNLKIS